MCDNYYYKIKFDLLLIIITLKLKVKNHFITREVVATVEVTKNSPTSVFCLPMTEDSSNSSNSSNYLLDHRSIFVTYFHYQKLILNFKNDYCLISLCHQ